MDFGFGSGFSSGLVIMAGVGTFTIRIAGHATGRHTGLILCLVRGLLRLLEVLRIPVQPALVLPLPMVLPAKPVVLATLRQEVVLCRVRVASEALCTKQRRPIPDRLQLGKLSASIN